MSWGPIPALFSVLALYFSYPPLDVKPDKVWVEPDGTIHELGTNTSVIQSGDQQPKRMVARYMAVWHRQPDGSLKYRLDLLLD
jgi:Na+-transporting NADH:ubiquinone oxidoreductase subunit NqrB